MTEVVVVTPAVIAPSFASFCTLNDCLQRITIPSNILQASLLQFQQDSRIFQPIPTNSKSSGRRQLRDAIQGVVVQFRGWNIKEEPGKPEFYGPSFRSSMIAVRHKLAC